jgi:flagellar basal-body rod modification protein FlgD
VQSVVQQGDGTTGVMLSTGKSVPLTSIASIL